MNVKDYIRTGILIAALEEFITQGVLRGTYTGWIIPTIIAFTPYLILMYFILTRVVPSSPKYKDYIQFYIIAGSIGLLFEWFIIGLAPWNDFSIAQIIFQLGMFSFWGSVAFLPIILTYTADMEFGERLRRFLKLGFVLVYFVAFTTPQENEFAYTIFVAIMFFLSLNYFYIKFFKASVTISTDVKNWSN